MNSRLNSVALAAMALSAGVSALYRTNTRYAGGPPTKKSGVCYNSDGNNTVDGAGGTDIKQPDGAGGSEEANAEIVASAGTGAGEQQTQQADDTSQQGGATLSANSAEDLAAGIDAKPAGSDEQQKQQT